MAGGEFCINATRALGFVLLQGQDASIELKVSGLDELVRVEVCQHQSMVDVKLGRVNIEQTHSGYLVHLQGISFVIFDKTSDIAGDIFALTNKEQKNHKTFEVLRSYGMDKYCACGLLLYEEHDGHFILHPFIYVKNTGTLYYESACGSGSVALAHRQGVDNVALSIQQQSTIDLHLSIDTSDEHNILATVGGAVEILFTTTLAV